MAQCPKWGSIDDGCEARYSSASQIVARVCWSASVGFLVSADSNCPVRRIWQATSATGPVSSKALATRLKLPLRHLEPVLQALVRDGILTSIRGRRGGYKVARDQAKITAEDIFSVGRIEEADELLPKAELIGTVVLPTLAIAE